MHMSYHRDVLNKINALQVPEAPLRPPMSALGSSVTVHCPRTDSARRRGSYPDRRAAQDLAAKHARYLPCPRRARGSRHRSVRWACVRRQRAQEGIGLGRERRGEGQSLRDRVALHSRPARESPDQRLASLALAASCSSSPSSTRSRRRATGATPTARACAARARARGRATGRRGRGTEDETATRTRVRLVA